MGGDGDISESPAEQVAHQVLAESSLEGESDPPGGFDAPKPAGPADQRRRRPYGLEGLRPYSPKRRRQHYGPETCNRPILRIGAGPACPESRSRPTPLSHVATSASAPPRLPRLPSSGSETFTITKSLKGLDRSRFNSAVLRRSYCIPDEVEIRLPSAGDDPKKPPPGYVAFFGEQIRCGAFLPLHPFLQLALSELKIAPAQLHPNAIRCLAGCYVLWKRSGRDISWSDILGLYAIRNSTAPDTVQLQARDIVPVCGLPSSIGKWRSIWFFVPSTWVGSAPTTFGNLSHFPSVPVDYSSNASNFVSRTTTEERLWRRIFTRESLVAGGWIASESDNVTNHDLEIYSTRRSLDVHRSPDHPGDSQSESRERPQYEQQPAFGRTDPMPGEKRKAMDDGRTCIHDRSQRLRESDHPKDYNFASTSSDCDLMSALAQLLSSSLPQAKLDIALVSPAFGHFWTAFIKLVKETHNPSTSLEELDKLKTEREKLKSALAETTANLSQSTARADQLDNDIKRLERDFEEQSEILRKQLKELREQRSELGAKVRVAEEIAERRAQEAVDKFKRSDEFQCEFFAGVDEALRVVGEKYPQYDIDFERVERYIETGVSPQPGDSSSQW